MSRPSPARWEAGSTPRRARRATSHSGKVSQAWNTSWATSAGWKGASKGKGVRSGSRNRHWGRSPAFLRRRTVSRHSAPATRASPVSPRSMASATSSTSTCGVVPPMPEYTACLGPHPRLAASRPVGSSYCQLWQYTTSMLSRRSTSSGRPASAAAARETSSHMSRGSGARSSGPTGRQVRWATPIRQGDLGSIVTGTRLSGRSSAGAASRRRPGGPPWRPPTGTRWTTARPRCGRPPRWAHRGPGARFPWSPAPPGAR